MANEETKKSTYNPKAQKTYNQKRKKLAVTVFNEEYDRITEHLQQKGYTSVNAYLHDLIKADMTASD